MAKKNEEYFKVAGAYYLIGVSDVIGGTLYILCGIIQKTVCNLKNKVLKNSMQQYQ